MHAFIRKLTAGMRLPVEVSEAVPVFLAQHGFPRTTEHCRLVAAEARRLADLFCEAPRLAEQAGWLHDVSAVIPSGERLQAARLLCLEVLPEEEAYPMILHQKLSAVLAREVFEIEHAGVLSAIGCHTTLKAGSSSLDKIVFIADKLAWDGGGEPPERENILAGLQQSLERGVFVHLDYLWQRREQLRCLHPWFVEAYNELILKYSVY